MGPRPQKAAGSAAAATPPAAAVPVTVVNVNTIQVGDFTVTPEEFPAAQLADYQWLKATEKVAPLDWSATSRYISVIGSGESERNNPVVFIAMEDIPKTAVVLHSRIAIAVENDDTSEVLAQKKRAKKFVETQARLAITGLPGHSAKRQNTTQHNLRTPDRKTRITIKEKLPARGKSVKIAQIMGSGWDTTEYPTTTDNIVQPETTSREGTSK